MLLFGEKPICEQLRFVFFFFRIRPEKPDSVLPDDEKIWSLDADNGRITLSEKHPVIAKRGSGVVNNDTYDYKFGMLISLSLDAFLYLFFSLTMFWWDYRFFIAGTKDDTLSVRRTHPARR
jgi:hypothetical protein